MMFTKLTDFCRMPVKTMLFHTVHLTLFKKTMIFLMLSLFGIITLPVLQYDFLLAHHEETALQNRD